MNFFVAVMSVLWGGRDSTHGGHPGAVAFRRVFLQATAARGLMSHGRRRWPRPTTSVAWTSDCPASRLTQPETRGLQGYRDARGEAVGLVGDDGRSSGIAFHCFPGTCR